MNLNLNFKFELTLYLNFNFLFQICKCLIICHFYLKYDFCCSYYFSGEGAKVEDYTNPDHFEFLKEYVTKITDFLKTSCTPNLQLWLGETSDANYGGTKGISDRYASGFLWVHEKHYLKNSTSTLKSYQKSSASTLKSYQKSSTNTLKSCKKRSTNTLKSYQKSSTNTLKSYQKSSASTLKSYQKSSTDTLKSYQKSSTNTLKSYQFLWEYFHFSLFLL